MEDYVADMRLRLLVVRLLTSVTDIDAVTGEYNDGSEIPHCRPCSTASSALCQRIARHNRDQRDEDAAWQHYAVDRS